MAVAASTLGWSRPPELRVVSPPDPSVDRLLERALELLGTPYVFGGQGRVGYDCSSFVCRVYGQSGWALPRVSRDQVRAGRAVALDAIAAGDLLFFAEPGRPISHVGIYLGGGEMVHASSGRGEVVVADVSSRWFRRRLVAARRILADGAADPLPEVEATELVEHAGPNAPALFLERARPWRDPDLGVALPPLGGTGVGARAHAVVEGERATLLLVPELSLQHPPWALEVTAGVPIEVPFDGPVTLGPTDDAWSLATRFLRRARLGLPGARLELALERGRSFDVGRSGFAKDILPSTGAGGLPGLTTRPSPLSAFAAFRGRRLGLELLVDDVVRPQLAAVAGAFSPFPWLALDLTAAGAASGFVPDRRGALGGLAAGLEIGWRDGDRGRIRLRAEGQGLSWDGGPPSVGAEMELSARVGFDRGRVRLGLDLFGAWVGPSGVYDPFGPVLFAAPTALAAALDAAPGERARLGGQVVVRHRDLAVRAQVAKGVGRAASPYDDTLLIGVDLGTVSLGRHQALTLAVGYAGRAVLAAEDRADALTGSARLRLSRFASLEALAQIGAVSSAGVGLAVAWVP